MLGIDENSIHLPATATNVAHVNPQSVAMMGEDDRRNVAVKQEG